MGFRTEPPEDWSVVIHSQSNVLVGGMAIAIDAFVSAVRAHVRQPVRDVTPQTLGAPANADGTLILRSVDALDRGQQATLLRWLETPQNQPRVISTSTGSVYTQVRAGTFLSSLFYRLNTIHITVVSE